MAETKLKLKIGRMPRLEGEGNALTLKLQGFRVNKHGKYVNYDIECSVHRYVVQRLLRQVATMHERDRVRLAQETARIGREIDAVKQPEVQA